MKSFGKWIKENKSINGEYYADYDEDTKMWCVFHTDKGEGKAFASFATKKEADAYAKRKNN
jgi:hypothetical protein